MGYYIEVPEDKNKARQLVEIHNAKIISKPKNFSDIPADKALICVVENGLFDAAAFCCNEREYKDFLVDLIGNQRPRTWLWMDLELTKKLTGMVK